jgi:hypothetical protein
MVQRFNSLQPIQFVFNSPYPTDESAQETIDLLCKRPIPVDPSIEAIASSELSLSDLQQKLLVRLKALEKTLFLDKQQFWQLVDTLAEKAGVKQGFAEVSYYVNGTAKGTLGESDPRVLDDLYIAQYNRLNRCIAACDTLIQIVDRTTPFAAILSELEAMVS